MSRREKKYAVGGSIQTYDFLWDGADHLRQVKQGVSSRFTASYNGEGLRVSKWDWWTSSHDYSWGPGGVLHDSSANTIYTPGFAQHTDRDRFYNSDWLGSTRYLSDGTGNFFPSAFRFDAFGQRSATHGPAHPSDFLFAGGACLCFGQVCREPWGPSPGLSSSGASVTRRQGGSALRGCAIAARC
jgi:hypothetical protein